MCSNNIFFTMSFYALKSKPQQNLASIRLIPTYLCDCQFVVSTAQKNVSLVAIRNEKNRRRND